MTNIVLAVTHPTVRPSGAPIAVEDIVKVEIQNRIKGASTWTPNGEIIPPALSRTYSDAFPATYEFQVRWHDSSAFPSVWVAGEITVPLGAMGAGTFVLTLQP